MHAPSRRGLLTGAAALSAYAALPAYGSVTTTGAGKKSSGGGGGSATFIKTGVFQFAGGGSPEVFDFGAGQSAGDFMIAYAINNGGIDLSLATGGVMTIKDETGGPDAVTNKLFCRVLTSTDASTHTVTTSNTTAVGYGFAYMIYGGGVTDLSNIEFVFTPFPGVDIPFTGFSPGGSFKGAGAMCFQSGTPSGTNSAITGWTRRYNAIALSSGFEASGGFDNTSYSGGAFTITGIAAAFGNPRGYSYGMI